ncbi:MAG: FprA family A-type flavoprotein [Lentisphaeria bacterium]|nr:FprA family A-type flavoprotein [Lentisphaeria bacterium]
MQAVKISEKVYWVGAIDWNLREFHGYRTGRGSTYNAYLILADKITLVDTVKAPFRDEMLQRIRSVIGDEKKIRCIVSNHAEMDHSGLLAEMIERVKPEAVYASGNGQKALEAHFGIGSVITEVQSGTEIDLGGATLRFLKTPMLHWPDSMFCCYLEEKILFSQDAFGMHFATSKLFADENDKAVMEEEMCKYYANILLPYSPQVAKLLGSVTLDFNVIAPDHGPVWRGEMLSMPVELYRKWSGQKPEKRAVIVYSTMWHSTEKMALAICDGLRESGIQVNLFSLEATYRSEVMTGIMGAGLFFAGSPTLNNQMYPAMADMLCYMKGLRVKNLKGAAFGSYGWSGEAVAQINKELEEMKVELIHEGMKVQYVPTQEDLQKCFELGFNAGTDFLKNNP